MKWEQYENLAKEAAEFVFATGIGLTRTPIPKAPLAIVAEVDPTALRADYSVQVTWTNSIGGEGSPSDVWQAPIASGDLISVPGPVPPTVTGWNVYLGPRDGEPLLQNTVPIRIGSSWAKPDADGLQGRPIMHTQIPDYLVVERRVLLRG